MTWYNASWTYRVPVVVQNAKVPSTQSNFPVYVDLSDLPAGFWSNVQDGGGDIRVTRSDGTTECAREVVSCATGTSTGELHFLADSLSSSATTTFYVYYGNAGASDYAVGDTYGRNAVWAGYTRAYHLGVVTDSRGSADFTNSGASFVPAKIGGGADFESTENDYCTATKALASTTFSSVSFWANVESNGGGYPMVAFCDGNDFTSDRCSDFVIDGSGYWSSNYSINGSAWADSVVASAAFTDYGNWHFYVFVRSSTGVYIYIDGQPNNSSLKSISAALFNCTGGAYLGRAAGYGSSYDFDGVIDEFRVTTTPFTAAWILTEYNNQSDTSTFYTPGAQETSGGAATTTIFTRLQNVTTGADIINARQLRCTKSMGDNNATSRVDFSIPNPGGRFKTAVNAGDELILYADKTTTPATKIFSGYVVNADNKGDGPREEIIVTARDWTALLQQITVEPEVYTGQEISVIVADLMTKYAPTGFTTTNVSATGKTIPRIVYKGISLYDAFRQLAELAGFYFYVDEDKDLHFSAKNSISSGQTFDRTNVEKADFKLDVDSVKNKVYVYGARQLFAHPSETFVADGAGSVFTLQDKPHSTNVTASGVSQVGDIYKGTESYPQSGVNYLVDYNGQNIIFISGTSIGYSSVPLSGVQVIVNYDVSRPIIKVAQDNASIAAYHERAKDIVDENITDAQTATSIAKNQVALYKDPSRQGTLGVIGVASITPGNTCVVNLLNHNILSQTYQILEAKYDFTVEKMLSDHVLTVKVSQRIGDITDVLKNLLLEVKRLSAANIDDTGILSRLLLSTGSAGFRVTSWDVRDRSIGHSFIPGHPINGLPGSPHLGIDGQQLLLGDQRGAQTIRYSGGES